MKEICLRQNNKIKGRIPFVSVMSNHNIYTLSSERTNTLNVIFFLSYKKLLLYSPYKITFGNLI
jgi:hypothetical protein